MRVIVIGVALLVSSLGCSKSSSNPEPGSEQPAASAETPAAKAETPKAGSAASPRIGGSVTAVGQFSVEILAHKSGFVQAVVTDAAGKAVEGADCKLELGLATVRDKAAKLALSWQPAELRFAGDARAELVPGPIDVSLTLGGKTETGKLLATALLVGPQHGGTLIATSDYGAELLAHANGEVQAFVHGAAGAAVQAQPSAKFSVKARARGGTEHDIALAFDAPSASFKGRAAAGVELVPGPIELIAEVDGKAQLGRLEKLCLFGEARHKGRLIAAGDYSVELVADAAGDVRAYVSAPSGAVVTGGDLDVRLYAGADASQKLVLGWHAACACYRGKLGAKLDLAVEPVQLLVGVGAKFAVGAVNAAKLSAGARAAVAADVVAKLNGTADVKTSLGATGKVSVKPPSVKAGLAQQGKAGVKAAVKVPAPKVDVKVDKSASAGAKAGTGAKAGAKAGISIGM